MIPRRVLVGTLVAVSATFLTAFGAAAQSDDESAIGPAFSATETTQPGAYVPAGPVRGELDIEGEPTFGETVMFVGEGFGADSTVEATVRSNESGEIVLTVQGTADAAGAASVDIVLDTPVLPGRYTASLTGQTTDGATVELTNSLVVVTEVTTTTNTTLGTSPTQEPGERNATGDGESAADEDLAGPVDSDDGGSNLLIAILLGLVAAALVAGGGMFFIRRGETA